MPPELLTTDDVDIADRPLYWREVICATYVELDAEPVVRDSFSGSVTVSRWGDVRISQVVADGQVVTRRRSDPRADCLISLQLSGIGRVSQAGRTAILAPGDLALYDATHPYELAFDQPFQQIVVQFPREALIGRNVHIPSAVAKVCVGTSGAGAVASSFVKSLMTYGEGLPFDSRARLGQQAVDCAATALALVAGASATIDALLTSDRQRVLAYIDRNVADPNLSVSSIASAFGVSTRTLQKLFAHDEVHLSERIRLARLTRVRAALHDPLRAHQSISRIAEEFGFLIPAHFSRTFKAMYGSTPREFRELVRTRSDEGNISRS